MTHLPPKTRDRVAKCVCLLRSDKDGEILAAVHALRRALEGEKHDLHALADLIRGTPSWGRLTPSDRLSWLRKFMREPAIGAGDRARLRALGIDLKAKGAILRPIKAEVRLFNAWSSRLFKQGIRP
jgi:hypothetical protein